MLLHYLKQVFRGLWRYKSFSFINLSGLSIGIAAVIILWILAGYENNFENFHSAPDKVFRVVTEKDRGGENTYQATVPYPLANMLRSEMPGLPATQIHYVKEMSIKIGNRMPFNEKQVLFADSLFFKVFDFAGIKNFWISGSSSSFLQEPNKAILTESTAKRYFGMDNPVGKLLTLDTKQEVEVVGIIKDIPATTHLPATMLISFSTLTKELLAGLDPQQWGILSNGYCYIRTDHNNRVIEKTLAGLVQRNGETEQDKKEKMYLQNLNSVHFDPVFEASNPSYTIAAKYSNMLLLLGCFILLIACINYINLSTSLAFSKSKEIGIRKTIGASRFQLFLFYLSETMVVTFVAACIGILMAAIAIPAVNRLLDKSVSLQQLLTIPYILESIFILLLISFLSGVYPALILSGFKPIESLKSGCSTPGKYTSILRKSLVAFQFTISIALIICTIVFARQTAYFRKKSLGFNKETVVEVALPVNDSAKMASFGNLLQNQRGIKNVSFCLGAPISDNGIGTSLQLSESPAKKENNIKLLLCDSNYLKTYEIKLVEGRWFLPSEEMFKDSATAIVVNETLVKTLGFKSPADAIGKKVTIGINDLNLPIIGVTRDFHTASFHQRITPVGLMPFSFFYYAAGIRVEPANLQQTLGAIETAWKKVYPDNVYQFKFIDETLAKLYEQETKDYHLFKAFSVISIFICCIGLWGLISFVVVRKTKEIGIRKVLGAGVGNIIGLLSKDFLKLIVLALLIASPIAWYFMNSWLQGFAYRISISWWIFVLAGVAAMVIAFFTISFQAIKAAIANPVDSLRTE